MSTTPVRRRTPPAALRPGRTATRDGVPWSGSAPDGPRPALAAALPGRQDLLDSLARLMPRAADEPLTLLLVGLVHREETLWLPTPVLDTATSLLAYAMRAGDHLSRAAHDEFAALVNGSDEDAERVADRVLAVVGAARVPDLTVAAGIVSLIPGHRPAEILRRATLSLTVARSIGGGQLIRYRGGR